MKYLKFVFENEEVCQLTDGNAAIIEVATQAAVYNSLLIENDIATNLESFISSGSDLVSIYESIKDYAISESISFYNQVNDILTNNSLSDEAKAFILTPVHEVSAAEVGDGIIKGSKRLGSDLATGVANFGGLASKTARAVGNKANDVRKWVGDSDSEVQKARMSAINSRAKLPKVELADENAPHPLDTMYNPTLKKGFDNSDMSTGRKVLNQIKNSDAGDVKEWAKEHGGSWVARNAEHLADLASKNPGHAAAILAGTIAAGAGAAYGAHKLKNRK
jgi:hypothetical protein